MYYGDVENYPYLMFQLIPWLNREIEDNDVERVLAMCTAESRHALMLLARGWVWKTVAFIGPFV